MRLEPLLSAAARIFYSDSAYYHNATRRFSSDWGAPSFDFLVQVATREDVQNTIQYANAINKPFSAVSGRHGFSLALGQMRNSIGILMSEMNDISIAADGQSARIGGGVKSGQLIHYLWPRGKQTVIGACECTGMVSPILGGGHGFLKGQYGLMADNLLEANLILANGTSITVSESQHSDLFWGLRGAGQNFGIVTDFQYRIHDRRTEHDHWSYEQMVFPLEKLEAVYEVAESQRRDAPVELGTWGVLVPLPDVSNSSRSLVFILFYQSPSLPEKYSQPFHALSPISINPGIVEFPGFAKVAGASMEDIVCQAGLPVNHQSPATNIERYNTTTLRKAAEILESMPAEFAGSTMLIEGYSSRAVQIVPSNSTAVPWRKKGILISPILTYPHQRPDLDAIGLDMGRKIQRTLAEGDGEDGKLSSYVNYATGLESREELYGFEPWRLEKLRGLKTLYDPLGRFDYYVPLWEGGRKREAEDCGKDEL